MYPLTMLEFTSLAPPARRAACLSIVTSGLILGLLIARVLSGAVAEFVSWRAIYWIAFGLQYLILILLWLFMPDCPSTNPDGFKYHHMLWSIPGLVSRNPLLAQVCLIGFCSMTIFTSFWTTLTFLLAAPPYNYNSFITGLFAFIGIASMLTSPFYGRYVIDRFVPLFSVIAGELICLTGVAIGTYIGTFTVAGPIIQALLIDLGIVSTQVASRSAIYSIEPKARNRVNAAYMISAFCGQMVGTFGGAKLYARGGWIASGSASIGFLGLGLLFCFARGPWEKGWVGWRGGWSIRRRDLDLMETQVEELGEDLEKA
ncbi:hypothetical protein FGG08_004097 [Glutinoglossum americanum]|uniref:Major facilitator superfamily (MFS) profile domain-containing protein n=1 Tax=Glutinoglossum americanum TaxID=1670608 RepID=A0A9P8I6C2_9PEZI|nr:hypothetical protein FGG08_004097 [Glutinoglossum americanum]